MHSLFFLWRRIDLISLTNSRHLSSAASVSCFSISDSDLLDLRSKSWR
jgi:hypothetical protein